MKKFCVLLFGLFAFVLNAQIINFPDVNFKNKLLAANPSNSIARDLTGIAMTIDVNSDGEIQLSEVINVGQISISSSVPAITNLTGIEYFTNLTLLKCNYNSLTSLNLSNLTNLAILECTNNQLANLNVDGLIHLSSLICNNNQLTNLDFSSLNSIDIINCNYNLLTSITIHDKLNLTTFGCSSNDITNINLYNLPNLNLLNCNDNQIASINLNDGLNNLTNLFINYNLLNSLDVSNLLLLINLYCDHNQFSYLDVNSLKFLNVLNCSESTFLQTILKKNGKVANINTFNFSGCPNLSYICVDDNDVAYVQNKLSLYGYVNCNVNSYCNFVPGEAYYQIMGNQKFDSNNDGCDSNDILFPQLKINLFADGNLIGVYVANNTGTYSFPVQAGNYTLIPIIENTNYYNVSPANLSVAFPNQGSSYLQDYCITPNGVHNDLEIILLPLSAARPGFNATYKLIYKNKGNTVQSGSIGFSYEDAKMDYVSSNPVFSSQTIGQLTFDYTNLQPFETREIIIVLNCNGPTETPAVNAGDQLNFSATIDPIAGDEIPIDNVSSLKQLVVGSLDPNDKTCIEGNIVGTEMIGEYVHYIIRFENTGNYAAQNIVVKDLIDTSKFDVSTLIPMSSSHDFFTRINENKVEFIFENINLPFDDANNDGYVAFKIKTVPTLIEGDTFTNNASIYFDYNFPIVTNTASTTIQALKNQDFEFSAYFSLYPNPAKNVLNIKTKTDVTISSISIYNALGQLIIVETKPTATIDVSRLKTGTYFIKISSDIGTSNAKFIKE